MERFTKGYDELTEYEQRVSTYIVQNFHKVSDMSINKLAEKNVVSKTVIINMAQKLGFSGYTDLRYYLKEKSYKNDLLPEKVVLGNETLRSVNITYNIINTKQVIEAAKLVNKVETVYVAARGTSKASAAHLAHLLLIAGIKCVLVLDYNILPIMARKILENELFIMISLSGETRIIVEAAEMVKARSGSLISLTSFTQNRLVNLADINLYVAGSSTDTADNDDISRIGFFFITEILAQQVKNEKLKT